MDVITDELHNKLADTQEKQALYTEEVECLLEAIKTKEQYGEYDHDLDLVDRLIHIRCAGLEKLLQEQAVVDAEACRLLAEMTQAAEDAD